MSDINVLKLKPYEKLEIKNSYIDFVTVYKNSYLNVANTIDSIFRTVINPFNIILFDNNSSNSSFSNDFSKFDNISFIKSKSDVSMGEGLNLALKNTSSSWIIFIDNNTLPLSTNWSINLLSFMQSVKTQGVKLVSPWVKNISFFENFDKNTILSNEQILPLHCFLCHRDLFSLIGLINPSCKNTQEISEDIYNKMTARKLKQAICYSSWVKYS